MTVKVNVFKSDARINISSVFCLIAHLPHADDITNMIDEAKRKAALANDTASNTMNKLDDIQKELDKIHVSPVDTNLSSVLDNVDKSGEFKKCHMHICLYFCGTEWHLGLQLKTDCYLLPAVKDLLNTIPSLDDKISEVENLTSQFSPISNISENIKKIKDLIEQARDAANRVRSCAVTASTYTPCDVCTSKPSLNKL